MRKLIAIPSTPKLLYASAGKQVFKSTDGGDTWKLQSTMPATPQYDTFAVAPSSPSTMYFASGFTVYRSTNEGSTWQTAGSIPKRAEYNVDAQALFVNPANPGAVYVMADSRSIFMQTGPVMDYIPGLYRSLDHGATFTNILGPHVFQAYPDPVRSGYIYAGMLYPHPIYDDPDTSTYHLF